MTALRTLVLIIHRQRFLCNCAPCLIVSLVFFPLSKVTDRMEMLKKQYDEKLAEKEQLRIKAEQMEIKLERAGKLVSGLAGERDRWEENVKVCQSRSLHSVKMEFRI